MCAHARSLFNPVARARLLSSQANRRAFPSAFRLILQVTTGTSAVINDVRGIITRCVIGSSREGGGRGERVRADRSRPPVAWTRLLGSQLNRRAFSPAFRPILQVMTGTAVVIDDASGIINRYVVGSSSERGCHGPARARACARSLFTAPRHVHATSQLPTQPTRVLACVLPHFAGDDGH